MLIVNATAYLDGAFADGMRARLTNGRVSALGRALAPLADEPTLDLAGDLLLPGFVDVHIHAFRGNDTMAGEAAVRAMSRDLYREGVAAFLPTTMSASVADTRRAIEGVLAVRDRPEPNGARVLGAHMEAPFLQPAKAGAQQSAFFRAPSMALLRALTGDRVDAARIVTLAPELDGAEGFIRQAVAAGVVASVGHTSATAEQTHAAADWGATHATHTFNAQSPLLHRAPGAPGATLTDDRLYAEFIADGIHLHPDAIRLLVRAKTAARAVAITDAMEATGMPDGAYALGGQRVLVRDGEARLADGTLAGSVLTMHAALENLIRRFGIPVADAVRMCTQSPAESIGEALLGRLAVGSPAPLNRVSADGRWLGMVDEGAAAPITGDINVKGADRF